MPLIPTPIEIPKTLTIQIDDREKYPLLFPDYITIDHPYQLGGQTKIRITTQPHRLNAGDYRLLEYPDCCIVERKGSQSEVIKNLFNPSDSVRQGKALLKLVKACTHPVLLLEVSPSKLLSPSGFMVGWEPDVLIHRITKIIANYNLQVLWLPQPASPSARRHLGTTILHLMLTYALIPYDAHSFPQDEPLCSENTK
jgi:hypothetical protein